MSRSRSRRPLAAVLLLALAALPAAALAPPRSQDPAPAASFTLRLWDWLASAWAEAGCIIDPGGGCAGAAEEPAPAERPDEGCIIDPNGRCSPRQEHPDAGCIIDPSGGCAPRQ